MTTTTQQALQAGTRTYAKRQAARLTDPRTREDAVRRYASHVDLLERYESPLTPEVMEEVLAYLTSL